MKVINVTKKTTISDELSEATTVLERGVGLLASSIPHSLLIRTRFGIHTLGMRYPIDIIILDSSYKVVKLKKHIQPNRIFLWNPKYSTVLELPKGTISESKTALGDSIQL